MASRKYSRSRDEKRDRRGKSWKDYEPVSKNQWWPNNGPQWNALAATSKEVLYGGARQGGKTEAGLAWMSDPLYTGNPRFQGLVLRQNYEDLSDWIHRARSFYHGLATIVGKPAEVRWNAGGVTRLGHWKDRDTLHRYIGHEYWKILIEELTQCVCNEEEYMMILGSCRCSEPDIPAQIFMTTNPGGPGHVFAKQHWIEIPELRLCEACHGEGCGVCRGGYIETGRKTTSVNQEYTDPRTGYTRIFVPAKIGDNPKADKSYEKYLNGLPEPLRSAWRDGSWDIYEGQFFSEYGVAEEPFEIPENFCRGQLYGSLDHGTTHPTSFGLWWVSDKLWEHKFGREKTIHRLWTYKMAGGTAASHAQEIFDRIESCHWTRGHFPEKIFYDSAMNTKTKINEATVRAPIDEYLDLWQMKGKNTQFVTANKNKINGCHLMRMLFNVRDNAPYVYYFAGQNRDYIDGMMAVVVDKNNGEVYAKQEGDDTADEARYGLIGIWSAIGGGGGYDDVMKKYEAVNRANANKHWMEM